MKTELTIQEHIHKLWQQEKKHNTAPRISFQDMQTGLGQIAFKMIDKNSTSGAPLLLVEESVDDPDILNAAQSAGFINVIENSIRFSDPDFLSYFAAIHIELNSLIQYINFERPCDTGRYSGHYDIAIRVWSSLSDSTNRLEAISKRDPLLAIECLQEDVIVELPTRLKMAARAINTLGDRDLYFSFGYNPDERAIIRATVRAEDIPQVPSLVGHEEDLVSIGALWAIAELGIADAYQEVSRALYSARVSDKINAAVAFARLILLQKGFVNVYSAREQDPGELLDEALDAIKVTRSEQTLSDSLLIVDTRPGWGFRGSEKVNINLMTMIEPYIYEELNQIWIPGIFAGYVLARLFTPKLIVLITFPEIRGAPTPKAVASIGKLGAQIINPPLVTDAILSLLRKPQN